MSDTVYWIWLAGCLGPASKNLHYLLDRYSSAYEIYRADSEELERLEIGERIIEKLCEKNMREAYAINDYCAENRIGILTYASEFYPSRLKQIGDPPAVLYFRGKLPSFEDNLSLAMVGTRKMSEYGKRSAYRISYELTSAGALIVSGMALGIDAVSAAAAIAAGGSTVAVLGTGVDVVYPKEHALLYDRIIENGAVISEFPPTTEPRKEHFPLRNRIISGITNGTLVVECDTKSGALITADHAFEQGRDVFALPGNIENKNANGTNRLIHDGAQMVLDSEDILKSYEFYYGKRFNYIAFSRARADSNVDEGLLERLRIYASGKRPTDDLEEVIISRENHLKPRKIPRNKEEKELPEAYPKGYAKKERGNAPASVSTEEELASLDEQERDIFLAMPDDRATGVDELMRLGYTCSDVMGTLAMLEIRGLVSSLPGGLYIKN